MSRCVDEERSEEAFHKRVEEAKQILREGQAVVAYYVEGLTVAEQARRIGISRDKVRFLQRVLKLRNGRIRSGWLAVALRIGGREAEAMP